MRSDPTAVTWRQSSHRCGNDGSCVQVADLGTDECGVRDSKLGDNSPVLAFPRAQLGALVASARGTSRFVVSG